MRLLAASFLSLVCASPLAAQVAYPPATIDTSALPSKADVQAAADAAAAAQAAAATKCAATPAIPGMKVVGGSAGTTGVGCRPINSTQPRITRTVGFTTGSDGTAAVAWTDMGAVPKIYVQEDVTAGATVIPKCYPITSTKTSTGVTVACYITQSILGLGLLPFAKATAGITGQVLAIPAS